MIEESANNNNQNDKSKDEQNSDKTGKYEQNLK